MFIGATWPNSQFTYCRKIKGVGYQISNGNQSWHADAYGKVNIPDQSQKRSQKRDLQSQIAASIDFSQFYNFDYIDEVIPDAIFYTKVFR